jgi:chaperone modulatory protein CbpM
MRDEDILTGVVLEDADLSVEELARACAVSVEWIVQHVTEGALPSHGSTVSEWRFSVSDLRRVRHIHHMERDFDAAPELAALVADLLDELQSLRARLRRARLD